MEKIEKAEMVLQKMIDEAITRYDDAVRREIWASALIQESRRNALETALIAVQHIKESED